MGDEIEIHIRERDAGAAGIVRGHKIARQRQAKLPHGGSHHDGREHMDADHRVASHALDRLAKFPGAGFALRPEVPGHMVLLKLISQAEELGRLAVEEHVPLADEPRLGRRQEFQAVEHRTAVTVGGKLLFQCGGRGVVAAAGITGENQDLQAVVPPFVSAAPPPAGAWDDYSAG